MAEIIPMGPAWADDLDGLDRPTLAARLEQVRALLAALDREEPEDMESEDHQRWGERHEELEDLADDILDRLDELEG